MRINYTFSQEEINAAKAYHMRMREAARMSRSSFNAKDAEELAANAKGAEEILIILGIYKRREE